MKIGDLVKYRSWRDGDPPIDSVPLDSRSWDSVGVVTLLTESFFGESKVPAAEYMTYNGDFHLAKISDLIVLNEKNL